MDRLIRNCSSIEELNGIIGQGLDEENYKLALDRLFQLVAEGEDNEDEGLPSTSSDAQPDRPTVTNVEDIIATTTDIDTLNSIISEDNWESNISHLAFQKILKIAGLDELLKDIPESTQNHNDDGLHTPTEYSEEDLPENFPDSMLEDEIPGGLVGGDDPVPLTETVSCTHILFQT